MTLGSYPEWSAAGESGMKKNKMDTQESVSYTHLDVYKRQE